MNSTISMVLKIKNALEVLPSLQNLMEEALIVVDELTSFAFNIRKEVFVVLGIFLFFLEKNLKKRKHIICFL
jgi:hypothetical protein